MTAVTSVIGLVDGRVRPSDNQGRRGHRFPAYRAAALERENPNMVIAEIVLIVFIAAAESPSYRWATPHWPPSVRKWPSIFRANGIGLCVNVNAMNQTMETKQSCEPEHAIRRLLR